MKAEKTNLIDELMNDIIEPGIQRLMQTRYFTELRSGDLSPRRIQAWALEHYLYNITIAKGQVICMFKYAHDPELYNAFAEKFAEEQHHPNLVKRFGFAMGLKEEDFKVARPTFENLMHMSVVLRNDTWDRRSKRGYQDLPTRRFLPVTRMNSISIYVSTTASTIRVVSFS